MVILAADSKDVFLKFVWVLMLPFKISSQIQS